MDPGPLNAITDVAGVEVGHTTLISGSGPMVVGRGPVRTGVTAIWPHRAVWREFVPAATSVPNGNGELTGLLQLEQLGVIGSPICLTGTGSVGAVYDALVRLRPEPVGRSLEPIVGETWDGGLSDAAGRHVGFEHVAAALETAASGTVAEGSVGGGTGMICYGFKGGVGTASRRLPQPLGFTVGALVQANHGARELLRIDGVPVGAALAGRPEGDGTAAAEDSPNSILMIVATDAPLLDYQLARLARRAVHGLAKTGAISRNSSGDFALAFSTARRIRSKEFWGSGSYRMRSVEQFDLNPLLEAAAEAVEEAIVNALFVAEDMVGRDDIVVRALPLGPTLALLERHGRLTPTTTAGRAEEGR
ncbi:MAG: P1 family peptidase [Thermoanaerobaculia bacterium]|nr:P1 family peptidase [Thermoanaerobaculia bacterium]